MLKVLGHTLASQVLVFMFRLARTFKHAGAISLMLARAPMPTGVPNLGLQ